jgi:hypothetical protein
MYFYVADDVEKARLARIQRAYAEHFGKLAIWAKEANARTILIFEDNDLVLTNEALVLEALESIEKSFLHRPREIYLVNTEIESTWRVRCLRKTANQRCELISTALVDVNPQSFVNITGR